MAYKRKTWRPGDPIQSAGLNNLEDGIEELAREKTDRNETGALAAQVDVQDTRLTAAEEDVTVLQAGVASVQTAEEELTRRMAMKAEANDLAHTNQCLDNAERELKETQLDVAAMQNDIGAAFSANEVTASDLRVLDRQVKMKAEANDLAYAVQQIDEHSAQISELDKQKANRNDVASALAEVNSKADAEEMRGELAMRGMANEMAGVAAELDRMDAQAVSHESAIGVLRAGVANLETGVGNLETGLAAKITKPATEGTSGQVLQTNGNGTTSWADPPVATDEQIGDAVSGWLDDHPEATTTVADGSVTMEKLATPVQEAISNGGKQDAEEAQLVNTELGLTIGMWAQADRDIWEHLRIEREFESRLAKYTAFYTGGNGIGFLFFTDPHSMPDTIFKIPEHIALLQFKQIRIVYENTPARFVLCGGDWMTDAFTQAQGARICGRVPNLLRREICEASYTVPGNHDGIDEVSLARVWYDQDVGYSTIGFKDGTCFLMDSGGLTARMTDYRWAEAQWFAQQLHDNTKAHLFGLIHVMYEDRSQYEPPIGKKLMEIANAFNRRTSIDVNGTTWNFSGCTGTFHFMLFGHNHRDENSIIHSIPVIGTTATAFGLALDGVYADFDNAVLHMTRFGYHGTDRDIPIIPNGGWTVNV